MVAAATAADGQWHSVGFTYDGATLQTYFDGAEAGSPQAVNGDTIRHNYISICGRRTLSNAMYFQGQLADFVVYNQALSVDAVMNYHLGDVQTTDAVLLASMDEDDYSAGLADASGNGHTGTSMGAIPIVDPATPPRPANGAVDINGDGTVTYTPNPGFNGIDGFDYTVKDNHGAMSNIATVTITVNSSPPIAENDEATTNEGEDVTINVIDNDMDTGGGINAASVRIIEPRVVASFDGIDDKITWGNLGLDGTPNISKFIRFRTTRAGGVLFDFERNGGFDGGFGFRSGNLRLRCGFQNSGAKIIDVVPAATAADGQWHSVGFTYDGATLTAYFDGVESGTPEPVNGDSIRHNYSSICGRRTLSNTMFFQGQLADFVVYDQALSTDAVMDYHLGDVQATDAVLIAKMDDEDYPEGLADASGNEHTGTSTGATPRLDPQIPVNGTLINNGDGTVTFTPNPGFTGQVSFSYTVEDDKGTVSNAATVTITVAPMPLLLSGQQEISKQAKKTLEANINTTEGVLVTPVFSEAISSATIYEDAEDSRIDGWQGYGDGSVVNMADSSGNRIISIQGNISSDPFRLGLDDDADWNNTSEFTAYFAILVEEEAAIYFRVDTTDGEKFLCYTPGTGVLESQDGIIHLNLGIEADGQWYAIYRDLAKDISSALPSAKLLSVKDLYIYGSAKIDNIMLLDITP